MKYQSGNAGWAEGPRRRQGTGLLLCWDPVSFWHELYSCTATARCTPGTFQTRLWAAKPILWCQNQPDSCEMPGKTKLPLLMLSTGTSMISSISKRVIFPSPSRSYISKAQLSFCSKVPLEVTDRAQMNSLKSMVPSPFLSKVRKACWANLEASP